MMERQSSKVGFAVIVDFDIRDNYFEAVFDNFQAKLDSSDAVVVSAGSVIQGLVRTARSQITIAPLPKFRSLLTASPHVSQFSS